MKKFQVFLGLTVLVLALYTVSAPVNADGSSLTGGGWGLYTGCMCNSDAVTLQCYNGPAGGCGGYTFIGIQPGYNYMSASGGYACNGSGASYCPNLVHSLYGC